ncbi:MAG: peptidylprolyl isomerase [Polyangiales bacterium]
MPKTVMAQKVSVRRRRIVCAVLLLTSTWPLLLQPAAAEPQPTAAEPVDPEAARRAQVVLTLDTGRITVGELEDAIVEQNPLMQARYASTDAVRALLEKQLRFELLAAEAERRGYGRDAETVLAQRQSAVQTFIKHQFDDVLTAQSIPVDDVRKYYDEHHDEFVRGEGRRASLLLVKPEAATKQLTTRAQSADLRAFRELVRSDSVDQSTKQRGGDLSYFDASGKLFDDEDGSVEPAISKAAFALREVGDTSEWLQLGEYRGILRLTGIRPAHEEAFAKAEERLRMRLWRERRQTAIDAHTSALKTQLNVLVHPELVDAVKLDSGPPLPPSDGLPSGFPHIPPESPPGQKPTGMQPR